MRTVFLLLACALATTQAQKSPAPAPEAPLLELNGTDQRPIPLSPRASIRAEDEPDPSGLTPIQKAMRGREHIRNGMLSVQLSVVLDLAGNVESAKPVQGPERFYAQATDLELQRRFEPVRDPEGKPTRAQFTDYISILPPEEWLPHPPAFPAEVDLRTFRIALERTGCFGSCPAYKVSVAGSGEVVWEGGPYTAAPGTHHAQLPREAVKRLVEQTRAAKPLAALDKYEAGWTDNPTFTLTLDVNGIHKEVIDYIGEIVGMPTSVHDLEDAIDQAAGSQKWIAGNADLMPALKAEHWDFNSATASNLQMYGNALRRGRADLLEAYSAGPLFAPDPAADSPVCVASGLRDSHPALAMLRRLPKEQKVPQRILDSCLASASQGGNAELARLWLKRGANPLPSAAPEGQPDQRSENPLLAAVGGCSPQVVQLLLDAHAPVNPPADGDRNLVTFATQYCRSDNPDDKRQIISMLLAAGANPNTETETDRPALFSNTDPALVPLLVAGGARVNQRDSQGKTALMWAYHLDVLKALLAAGADPALRDKDGHTAAQHLRTSGLTEQADLLDKTSAPR